MESDQSSNNVGNRTNGSRIPKAFQPIYGHPCWGVRHDGRFNLSMNFGEPSLEIREPYESHSNVWPARRIAGRRRVTVRGEWWLWFYACYWRLSLRESSMVTGSSTKRAICRGLAQLDGQKLVSVDVDLATGATRLTFDLGADLTCRRMEKGSRSEIWMLYEPDGNVLAVDGCGTITEEPKHLFLDRRS